jgi:ssDNA-binding Zn-finger/Zn-ribbon topoisomerase 1
METKQREWGICPKCKKPTKITEISAALTTLVYYPPIYDENGININPDANKTTRNYRCLECGIDFVEITRNGQIVHACVICPENKNNEK